MALCFFLRGAGLRACVAAMACGRRIRHRRRDYELHEGYTYHQARPKKTHILLTLLVPQPRQQPVHVGAHAPRLFPRRAHATFLEEHGHRDLDEGEIWL